MAWFSLVATKALIEYARNVLWQLNLVGLAKIRVEIKLRHWWKNRLPSSPISREAVGTATNGTFSRGSGGEPRPKAWAQGARWPAGAREGL